MADNYLERKMEEYRAQQPKTAHRMANGLERLLSRNRSYRGYDTTFKVRKDQLKALIACCAMIPSARNRQGLRYRAVSGNEAINVLKHIKMGGALPELHLPFAGTAPNAYIVICAAVEPDNDLYIDLGIAAQSILLRAVEMGLGGLCIRAFNRRGLAEELGLELEPLMVLAIGRPAEKIELVPITPEAPRAYYRHDGVHYVPKLTPEALTIAKE